MSLFHGPFFDAPACALMTFREKAGNHIHKVWNTRDGKVPVELVCPCGIAVVHVTWSKDEVVPGYLPSKEDLVIANITRERSVMLREKQFAKHWDGLMAGFPGKTQEEAVAIAVAKDMERAGEPDVLEVTDEYLAELQKGRVGGNASDGGAA